MVLGTESWTGSWKVSRRENWNAYLEALGIAEAAWEEASQAADFHTYRMTDSTFTMEHKVPAQNTHLHFKADLDGEWHDCPYPKPTVAHWDGKEEGQSQPEPLPLPTWKTFWLENGTKFQTEIPNFMSKGIYLRLVREIISETEIKMTVDVFESEKMDKLAVGPCYSWLEKVSSQGPAPIAFLRSRGKSLKTAEERCAVLAKISEMMVEGAEEITKAQIADRVEPSKFNPAMICGACKYYMANLAGWMEPEVLGDTCPDFLKAGIEAEYQVVCEPKGVCINVAPWNAPMTLAVLPVLPMISAGNHVVVKPPELTPTVSAVFRRLCTKYLSGYVWAEEGGREAVERLIDEGADHLVFTGGSETAKIVAARCAAMLTPVTLELGGKSPVFIDKGMSPGMLASSVQEILETKVFKTGQFCCAHDYALVHEEMFDDFCSKLSESIAALGEKRNVKLLGPKQYESVKALFDATDAKTKVPALEGSFVPNGEAMTMPMTALIEPARDASILQKEIFGPILPVLKVTSLDEATEIIKSIPTGKPLIAYCYSQDEATTKAFIERVAAGNVAVNAGPMRFHMNFNVNFGGIGSSGMGAAFFGKDSFREFSNRKHVCQAKIGFAQSYWSGPPPAAKG